MAHFGKEFTRALRWLRKTFPTHTGLPIELKVDSRLKEHGEAVLHFGKKWVIRLNPKQSNACAINTLFHEWAHCLQDEIEGSDCQHHSDTWGVLYARIYTAYYEE